MKLKKTVLFLVIFWMFGFVHAQSISKKLPFNELGTSINFSLAGNTPNLSGKRVGLGCGIYKSFQPEQKVALVVGLEYNFIQFDQDSLLSVRGYYLNAHITHNIIRLPITLRMYFNEKRRFFFEPGFYSSLMTKGSMQGTEYLDWPMLTVTEKARTSISYSFSAGILLGLGYQIQLSKGKLMSKLDVNIGSGKNFYGEDPYDQMKVYYDFYPRIHLIYQLP